MSTHDEADSFDEFVRSRSTALLRSAYLLTTDRHAAEDLLQDVLERLYAKWQRARSAPDTYARKILVNRAVDRWRFRGRRPETPLGERTGTPALDHADHVVVRQTVLAALRTLPPRQRAAVVLRYLDDLSEAETAQIMGCSVGAVKSHTARGLTRLREQAQLGPADPPVLISPTAEPTRRTR
ncbi:SigE family RNA polymerase sigma factor [Micromonospora mirobrigensis]|uniref:RNA polymerase sigma-70 factor, sigma-E family n=1 Tax=Micromonospora mirobrigensis TaxID=262898 RepID=A0A1C5AMI3_9ACTN|nr:SigE family RNA polymerase sigma factor [Micromonospora mirobrigensis]SCF46419.1 RNA polymerase sigma-70 factor, sigma-E family [Micromonospora mirobrigensis]